MLQTLRNAWKIPELRQKIIFTLFILLIYRVGNVIPVPFIDVGTLANYFDSVLSNTILGLYNAMSGSAFSMGGGGAEAEVFLEVIFHSFSSGGIAFAICHFNILLKFECVFVFLMRRVGANDCHCQFDFSGLHQ